MSYSDNKYMLGMTYRYASGALRNGRPFQSLCRWSWALTVSARFDDRVARIGV